VNRVGFLLVALLCEALPVQGRQPHRFAVQPDIAMPDEFKDVLAPTRGF
jgi:hypothetical protein